MLSLLLLPLSTYLTPSSFLDHLHQIDFSLYALTACYRWCDVADVRTHQQESIESIVENITALQKNWISFYLKSEERRKEVEGER